MQYTITKPSSASSQAAAVIKAMILDGKMPDGTRINEVHLADELEVSRTPIREGLGQLVAEGFVQTIPKRGFFVCNLTVAEFSDLYDLRPILDPQALLMGRQPTSSEIDKIEVANQHFMKAKDGQRAVGADNKFHQLLLANCPNAVLLDMIDKITTRTLRYELALFRETPRLPVAGDEHVQIIQALRNGDLKGAAEALRLNLTTGKEPILDWLAARNNN